MAAVARPTVADLLRFATAHAVLRRPPRAAAAGAAARPTRAPAAAAVTAAHARGAPPRGDPPLPGAADGSRGEGGWLGAEPPCEVPGSKGQSVTWLRPAAWRAPGALTLWHKPGRAAVAGLRAAGATHVVTLLSDQRGERTSSEDVAGWCAAHGLEWVGMPLDGAAPPYLRSVAALLRAYAEAVAALCAGGARVLLHCSAGLHRTGTVAYLTMRVAGAPPAAAAAALRVMRPVTADGVREERLQIAEAVASGAPLAAPPPDPAGVGREKVDRRAKEKAMRGEGGKKGGRGQRVDRF